MKKIDNSFINRAWNKLLYGSHMRWIKSLWFNIVLRRHVTAKIRKRIKGKGTGNPVRIIFFVLNIGMWKYESVFKKLLADKRFEPIIVPYANLWIDKKQQKNLEKEIAEYCIKHGFPFLRGYDIDSGEYIPAAELKADMVCFTQPYNNYPYFWRVEKFYRDALIFYYPYGFHVDHRSGGNKVYYNLLLHNVAWRIFYNTSNGLPTFRANQFTHGHNYRFVGSLFDEMLKERRTSSGPWNDTSHRLKRIIWAPHHTIEDTDMLPISNFMTLSDAMKELACDISETVEIAFKPHPILRARLESCWGKEKTDEYYNFWASSPNTLLAEGDYTELFATSDAMIHDSVTFMMDYLFTGNPVMFTNRTDISRYIEGLSLQCHEMHYQGKNIEDIKDFIRDVVIEGNDTMKERRIAFTRHNFIAPEQTPASEAIISDITALL